MSADDKEWQKLTFAQRVGAEPLPEPLQPTELSKGLRAALWGVIFEQIQDSTEYGLIDDPWRAMLFRKHVFFDKLMADLFDPSWAHQQRLLSQFFSNATYSQVYGCVEHFLRDSACPERLQLLICAVLRDSHAPYRVLDNKLLVPIASPEQGQLLVHALEQLRKTPLAGASQHLKHSIEFLNKGQWAKSIAESIHAVESVARKIEPSANTLDPALKKLAARIGMHVAMQKAFSTLYGYTNDEQGIRHALIDKDAAAVDRDDAIFMLTTCAAFSAYLANKATVAKLI